MIESILQIPDEVLEANLERDPSDVGDYGIIAAFLNEDFKIESLERFENYEEAKNSDRISQEQVKLLDCETFTRPKNLEVQKKQIGGIKNGLYTCSPIHVRLSETYINYLLKKERINKVGNFLKSVNKEEFFGKKQNLYSEMIKTFFELLKYKNKVLNYKNKSVKVETGDYLLFLPSGIFVDEFMTNYKKFIERRLSSNWLEFNNKQTCFLCGEKYNRLTVFSEGNFEGKERKCGQIFHKFRGEIEYYSNGLVCKNCLKKLQDFFQIVKKRKIYSPIPLPLNIRWNTLDSRELIFDKNTTLLEKLKSIYTNNRSNPFDYMLLDLKIERNRIDNYRFEYVPQFQYNIREINNIVSLRFNLYKKEEIFNSNASNKGKFLNDIRFIFLNNKRFNQNLFKKPKKMNIDNSFLKFEFLKFKDKIINFVFKQDSWFLDYGLKELTEDLLNQLTRNKELKKFYNPGNKLRKKYGGRKLLLIFYKYEKGDSFMKYKKLVEIENNIEKVKSQYKKNKQIDLNLKNDFEGAYIAGQIMSYLLSQSESKKNPLDLLGNYLISIHSFEDLKRKICDLTQKYRYKIANSVLWKRLNELFLGYKFENDSFKDNIIAFYTGLYADNIFYTKKENGGKKNDKE